MSASYVFVCSYSVPSSRKPPTLHKSFTCSKQVEFGKGIGTVPSLVLAAKRGRLLRVAHEQDQAGEQLKTGIELKN